MTKNLERGFSSLSNTLKRGNNCVPFTNRSKIGININHHQATSGLGYRVFDILASSALLITNFQEDSDFKRLFGEDHKIPTYRTPEELRREVKYYLDHDDKRKELVDYCNQLVAKGFSFEERATQIIQIAYPDFVPSANKQLKTTYISIPKFYT
jgi:spore maturation protein CgeB